MYKNRLVVSIEYWVLRITCFNKVASGTSFKFVLKSNSFRTFVFSILITQYSILLTSCNNFFGKKTDYTFIEAPIGQTRTITYVPIYPFFTDVDMQDPIDIIVGYDQQIYVADGATQKIICFDQTGAKIGSRYVPGLTAIAQDRTLDILAIGTFDTIIGTQKLRLATIYRFETKNSSYGITDAIIQKKIIHPTYVTAASSPSTADTSVRFKGIATLADNSYIVSRNGNDQSTGKFLGPDDAMLIFDKNDKITAVDRFVRVTTDQGEDLTYFRKPGQVTTFAQPPQSDNVNKSTNFFFLSNDITTPFKAQQIQFTVSDNGNTFKFLRMAFFSDTSKTSGGVLYDFYRFYQPSDITISGDGNNYIFMTDVVRDSVYQFESSKGYEGVTAPAYFTNRKSIKVSFGGTGNGPTQFNQPKAVAHYAEGNILLVADAGNKRISRFRLTSDLNK